MLIPLKVKLIKFLKKINCEILDCPSRRIESEEPHDQVGLLTHRVSTGASSEEDEAIGKSVAGNTTKIHMATDAHGLPIDFEITGGEVHDCKVAPEFFAKLPDADYMIADKGYNSEEVRNVVRVKSSTPVIPRKSNSKIGNDDIDWGLYKHRHLVENVFARLKHFRAIATRYDKLKRNYASMVALACGFMWVPM